MMTQNLNRILVVIMLIMLPCAIINFKANEANNDVGVIIIKICKHE